MHGPGRRALRRGERARKLVSELLGVSDHRRVARARRQHARQIVAVHRRVLQRTAPLLVRRHLRREDQERDAVGVRRQAVVNMNSTQMKRVLNAECQQRVQEDNRIHSARQRQRQPPVRGYVARQTGRDHAGDRLI